MKAAPTFAKLLSGPSRSTDGIAIAVEGCEVVAVVADTAVLPLVQFAKGAAGASGRGLSARIAPAHICCSKAKKQEHNRFGLINKTMEFLAAQSQVVVESIECNRAIYRNAKQEATHVL